MSAFTSVLSKIFYKAPSFCELERSPRVETVFSSTSGIVVFVSESVFLGERTADGGSDTDFVEESVTNP